MPEKVFLKFRCEYPTRADNRPEFGGDGDRCDNTDTWEADGALLELSNGDSPVTYTKYIRVENGKGNCPACQRPGVAQDVPDGATVLLS